DPCFACPARGAAPVRSVYDGLPGGTLKAALGASPLMNGAAMSMPTSLPYTVFMPTSAGSLPDVCPAHVATTQSGVYAMNQASVKLSVVPDLEATSRVMPSCHCLLYCRRTPVT